MLWYFCTEMCLADGKGITDLRRKGKVLIGR